MIINRVTITGADDSIAPSELVRLSRLFPFVEWGLLLSRHHVGSPRFPSYDWLSHMLDMHTPTMQFAGHVCGEWVRDMLGGSCLFAKEMSSTLSMCQRLQWNFHAERHQIQLGCVETGLNYYPQHQHILQMDGVNDALLDLLRDRGINVVPLFDTSGGAGRIPKEWPSAIPRVYCGYAGGLGPDTLEQEITRIEQVAEHATIWIDMERRVRSHDDQQFDLTKVEACLRLASRWVTQ